MPGIRILPLASLLLVACASPRAASLPRQPVVPTDTLLDVGGHRLHFKVWQRKSDLTLVFQSGGGSDLRSWDSVPDMAARTFPLRVVAYDRAGLGSSELGPLDLTPDQEIEHLRGALDRLGGDRIVLIGHSYGGLLALYQAFRQPDRIAGLVLVDPMNVIFIRRMTLDWLQRTVPEITNPSSPRDIVITRMKRTMSALVAGVEPATLDTRVPLVVISAGLPFWNDAAADLAWRESHQAFTAAVAGRQLIVASRSSHGIPASEPGLIIQGIEQVLSLVR